MIKLKDILKEGFSTTELFTEYLYLTGDLGDFLETVKENMLAPEMLDDFDMTQVEKLQKVIRKTVAEQFIKRINKNSTEEEMVKAFTDAINVTYNNDKFINIIVEIIQQTWKDLDGKLKALANLGWATTRKSKIKAGIKEAISELIFYDSVAIDNSTTKKFHTLFEPAWKNNGEDPWGAHSKIEDEVWAAYETKGAGPFPYNIDHVTDKIYNAVGNL
jgi:hypothetical protein